LFKLYLAQFVKIAEFVLVSSETFIIYFLKMLYPCSRQEDSEWSVSFMPPESDSDSESDSESFHQPVVALSQESDSERIIFGEGISESGSEEISQSNNNEVSSEEQSGTRNIILR